MINSQPRSPRLGHTKTKFNHNLKPSSSHYVAQLLNANKFLIYETGISGESTNNNKIRFKSEEKKIIYKQ